MKIFAIEYIRKEESVEFYAYTCKFLSSREKISETFYEELKKICKVPHVNNKHLQGLYFKD